MQLSSVHLFCQACGKLGRLLKIQTDGDMVVLVDNQKFTFSPSSLIPVSDPKIASKAPPVPDEDEEEEEQQQLAPEGDSVPGRKLISNTNEDNDKQNLKGSSLGAAEFVLL